VISLSVRTGPGGPRPDRQPGGGPGFGRGAPIRPIIVGPAARAEGRPVRPAARARLVALPGPGPAAIAQGPAIDDEAQARLDAPITLHFPEETPLDRVLDAVRAAGQGLTIAVDRESLKAAGVADPPTVRIDVAGVPTKSALTQLVRSLKLTYAVKGATLTIAADPYREPDPKDLEARMSREDTTAYAPQYDEGKFRSIRPGMAEAAVVRLVGKPLREGRSRPQVEWYYGPPTLRVADDGGLYATSGDFDPVWGFTVARARPDGKVFEVLGGYFDDVPKELIGADLAEFRRRFGEPVAVHTNRASRHLLYSATKSSGSYRTRVVGLDPGGKVVEVIAGYDFE